ncbi:hypothetical protein J6590_087383 [Homalodisca vitripennis]|nr:hypothetical protein J6590_087383 [Homalodisca vitripennis]
MSMAEGHHESSSDTENMSEQGASQLVKPLVASRPMQSTSNQASPSSSKKRPSTNLEPPQRAKVFKMQPINRRTPTRFESAVDKLHSIARMTSDDTEDQYDKFGQHIASQLRQLPLRSFIILQSKFQNLITEERLASLNANTSEPLSQSIFNDEVDDTSGSNITSNNDFEHLYSELSCRRRLGPRRTSS